MYSLKKLYFNKEIKKQKRNHDKVFLAKSIMNIKKFAHLRQDAMIV